MLTVGFLFSDNLSTVCFLLAADSECHHRHSEPPRNRGASIRFAAGECHHGNSGRYDDRERDTFLELLQKKVLHVRMKQHITNVSN